jgi:hypothetical protein
MVLFLNGEFEYKRRDDEGTQYEYYTKNTFFKR